MRVFLACSVDRTAADRLHAELEPLRRAYAGSVFNHVPPANYHVTLRFFGELAKAQVDRAVRLIEPVAAAMARFDGRAIAARPLPNARRPNVIVLPIESSGRLEALAADFRTALNSEFGPPDKPFKAHLTIIRCRRGARFIETAGEIDFRLAFTQIALFESTAGAGAPTYTPLREFRLGQTTAS
jgi:2'-5' RNA ligase